MRTSYVAILALALAGCGQAATGAQPASGATGSEVRLKPQQVLDAHMEIETADEQPVGGVIRAAGRVTFDDLRVAHVFSPVTGRITRIIAQPGQRMKKGQPLCVIQSPDLGSAVSDMAKAQADLVAAEHDWKRQKELFEAHAAAQKDYEAAEDNYLKSKAELERATRKARMLRNLGATLNSVTQEYLLPSPIDGEVITRGANPGLEVQGQYSGGTAVELYTIGELDRVWVLADIFEMDFPKVKQDATVNVKVLSYPNRIFSGHVEWISSALDPTSRTAKVRCSIENPKRELRPEMYGTALITVNAERRLAIKRSAMLLLGEQPVIFVQTGTTPDGLLRFERRPVAVDEMAGSEEYVPVIRGVERGEKVVTAGAVLLLGML
jgi:cobalt-zinc-cadmium efflux system membrane fusion protein